MTSSILTQVELSPVRDVRTDDAILTVELADGRSIATPLEWYPRLAFGTPEELAVWKPMAGGAAIHWPELDEDISVEGLIAGRKSGESGKSLHRWREIQQQLRQMPRELREWRRDVLRVGRLGPAATIVKRASETVEAYDMPVANWTVGAAADPFALLARHGMVDDSPLAVFQAESSEIARQAVRECVAKGMRSAGADDIRSDDEAYVFVFSQEKTV
jgi:hypothetical protein